MHSGIFDCFVIIDIGLLYHGLYVCLFSSKAYWCRVSLCHQQNGELSYILLLCEGHLYIKEIVVAPEQILVEPRVLIGSLQELLSFICVN